jgi:bacillithiol system protein YtxJ
MGFLNKILGSANTEDKEEKNIPWNKLSTLDQLDSILEDSLKRPIVIFKYSTRCGTSRMVLREFERNYSIDDGRIKLYFLDLIAFRDVSDEVAIRFQVLHHSPQLIVIKNGNTVHHSSHYSIDAEILEKFI